MRLVLVVACLIHGNLLFSVNLPYNDDFPKAKHPYAQAPDGCSGIKSPREVRDTWGPVDFTPTCDQHDRCYYTYGSDWKKCNEAFRKGLLAACREDLRVWIPGIQRRVFDFSTGKWKWVTVTPGRWSAPEPGLYSACASIATSYYLAVQAGVGFGVFKDAQELQRDYLKWVRQILDDPTRFALTCIFNDTNFTINYGLSWGNDPMVAYSVEKGKWRGHYYTYSRPNENRSPAVNISFDYDLSPHINNHKKYSLLKFATTHTNCDRLVQKNIFRFDYNNRNWIDLFYYSGRPVARSATYGKTPVADAMTDPLGFELAEGEVAPIITGVRARNPGDCAKESPRFSSSNGGCLDRKNFTVFSAPNDEQKTYEQAFTYCDELKEGGFEDWALPGSATLLGLSGFPFETFFKKPAGGNRVFWSSSAVDNDTGIAAILSCKDEKKDPENGSCGLLNKNVNSTAATLCERNALPAF